MVIWFAVEIVVSAVGMYNISKGVYNMYRDAETIKKKHRQHQKTIEEYRNACTDSKSLTESQYHRYEGEFLILNSKSSK